MQLMGRRAESAALNAFVKAVRDGQSRALVLRGEAGVGKSALLDYVAGRAEGCRVARATGVQSEMELVFAALHQICAPMLEAHLDDVPEMQRAALLTAFGANPGPAPDRFLVGLAMLSLFSAVAADRPLICLIDDEQWLDHASALVLTFVARRLSAEGVGMLFAVRDHGDELTGLPDLTVSALHDRDARNLLDAGLTVPIDARLRDRIIAEARGNPLALVEVPRALGSTPELAGGYGLPGAVPHAGRVEDSYRLRLDALPESARGLLLVAAAEPAGDPALVWSAAARLGIGADAAAPAAEAGLADFGTYVRFRHPLARSTVYRSASVAARLAAHRALAEVIDPQHHPDRHAWHRAHASSGPDDEVADELERSAGRAQARGGLAAAAAFLERAAVHTTDPMQRAARALAAASAKADAGLLDAALGLLTAAEAGPLNELQRARADLLRAQLTFIGNRGNDAPALLIKAARRFEPIDPGMARATYLTALSAAMFAGRLAVDADITDVARAAVGASQAIRSPEPFDLLLQGWVTHFTDGYAASQPILRQALNAVGGGMSAEDELRWLWLAGVAALHLWDDERARQLARRHVEAARELGALSELPLALTTHAFMLMFSGELGAAALLIDEVQAATAATNSSLAPYGALGLAAMRGRFDEVNALVDATTIDATHRGEGLGIAHNHWANAVLNNGLGRYGEALAAARSAADYQFDIGSAKWALVELVEAAIRAGAPDEAAAAYERLAQVAGVSDTDWARGIDARARALISEGPDADLLYQEAIARLGLTAMRADLARAHLLYGEWLRRERRRSEARAHLRDAHRMLEAMGMAAFAERARRELHATGETAARRDPQTGPRVELTAQEAQIARLANDGLSNPEIGTRLFISARTVQYHLRKVFTKLGISSRGQLEQVLPAVAETPLH